jgi:outer membrane protein assembly factor BamB
MIITRKKKMGMKEMFIMIMILCGVQGYSTVFKGTVFLDREVNGKVAGHEKGFAKVAVSDGLNVVLTDAAGKYELPGTPKTRFVFITVPAGYQASEKHYLPVDKNISSYDFGLIPFANSKKKTTRFLQLADTETYEDNGWVKPISDYAKNEKASFIVHTGDICYEKGLNFHGEKVTSKTMGVPVYYCIGNHDLVKGDYGEQLFEHNFGPVYYSFEAGNTHYLVTPMLGGDYKPSYTKADVYRWMKNDLQYVDKKKNIVIFNHDLLTFGNDFVYGINDKEQINLNEHNLKAWIYGHWHINYMKKHGNTGIVSVCASTPDKGGIDHSSSNFVVYEMDQQGVKHIDSRYNYLDKHLTIVCPNEDQVVVKNQQLSVSVNFYSTVSPTKMIECRLEDKIKKSGWVKLAQQTDWNWSAKLKFNEQDQGRELKIRVRVYTNNGDSVSQVKSFIAPGSKNETLSTTKNPLKLAWIKNTGGNIWMTSPVCDNGKVFVATMDEFSHRSNYIVAYQAETGELLWKYQTASSIKNSICVEKDLVLATDEEGVAYAIDANTGTLKWKKELGRNYLGACISGNLVNDGVLYTGFGNYLSALTVADGSLLWKNSGWGGGEGTTSTHSLAGKTLITGSNWQALYGHDLQTGKKKWEVSEEGIRFRSATSVFVDDTLFVVGEKTIVKMNPNDGKIYKSYPGNYGLQSATTPLITNTMILLGTAANGLVAYDRMSMKELWNVKTGNSLIYTSPYSKPFSCTVETAPIWVGKHICFGASDGFLYLVDSADGRIIQRIELGSPILGKVCFDQQSIYVADFSGNLSKFSLQ